MQNDRPTAGEFGPTVFSLFCEFFSFGSDEVSPSPTRCPLAAKAGLSSGAMQMDRRDAFRHDPFSWERQGDPATEVHWHLLYF